MREVPMRYVKANQLGIVVTVVLSFFFEQLWPLAGLWVVQVIGLLTEGRFNLFVVLAKLLIRNKGQETQAAELQRFNNSLAVLFLTLSVLCFLFHWQIAGYVFASMLLLAASAALLGYCIGCTLYFWMKQLRAGRSFR